MQITLHHCITYFTAHVQIGRDIASHFQNLCQTLLDLDDSKIKKLKIRVNSITDLPEVNCFVQEIEDFMEVGCLSG